MKKTSTRALLILAALTLFVVPVAAIAAGGAFIDDDTSIFEADIEWMAANGITSGCNPPTNDRYCPGDNVTRGQMAAFMKRLATKKVVDAATAVDSDTLDGQDSTAFLGKTEKAADADKLDGKDSTAFMQHGTIVTTAGGAAWLPYLSAPSTITRVISAVAVSGDGSMVLGVNAPASFDGVEYGLESIEVCVDVTSPGYLDLVKMYRTDEATAASAIMDDTTNRTTDGCYVYPVGKSLARGAGIYLVLSGGGTVRIEGTTLTWTRDAFVTSASGSSGSGENG